MEYRNDSITCGDNKLGRNYYCIPRVFKPTPESPVSQQRRRNVHRSGERYRIAKAFGKGLGVVTTDVNNDGRPDLFVANDTVQNFLFINRGAKPLGRSRPVSRGRIQRQRPARSGMGVDSADFDGDGWEDLFVANVDQEMFSLVQKQEERDVHGRVAPETTSPRRRGY